MLYKYKFHTTLLPRRGDGEQRPQPYASTLVASPMAFRFFDAGDFEATAGTSFRRHAASSAAISRLDPSIAAGSAFSRGRKRRFAQAPPVNFFVMRIGAQFNLSLK